MWENDCTEIIWIDEGIESFINLIFNGILNIIVLKMIIGWNFCCLALLDMGGGGDLSQLQSACLLTTQGIIL